MVAWCLAGNLSSSSSSLIIIDILFIINIIISLYLAIIRRRRSKYCWIIRLGDYSTILTEPEVNNCFSIFTRSDLNRIRKETFEKYIGWVWLTGEFMREHEAVNSGCAKVRSLQYLQTWQMIILIFLSRFLYLQHQWFKRKRRKFKLLPNSEKKSRALFVFVNSLWMRKFYLSLLPKCYQQQLRSRWALFICSVLCLVNLLTLTVFENICHPFFSIN